MLASVQTENSPELNPMHVAARARREIRFSVNNRFMRIRCQNRAICQTHTQHLVSQTKSGSRYFIFCHDNHEETSRSTIFHATKNTAPCRMMSCCVAVKVEPSLNLFAGRLFFQPELSAFVRLDPFK